MSTCFCKYDASKGEEKKRPRDPPRHDHPGARRRSGQVKRAGRRAGAAEHSPVRPAPVEPRAKRTGTGMRRRRWFHSYALPPGAVSVSRTRCLQRQQPSAGAAAGRGGGRGVALLPAAVADGRSMSETQRWLSRSPGPCLDDTSTKKNLVCMKH